MNTHPTICLILAAGTSERFANTTPKPYYNLAGKPIIHHCATTFLTHKMVDMVCIIYNPAHQEFYNKSLGDLNLLPPIPGGKTRQESVYLGLLGIAQFNPGKVLIHDAARPLIDHATITSIITKLDTAIAAIPVLPIFDSVKTVTNNIVTGNQDRTNLNLVQTPQGFIYEKILNAHKTLQHLQFTDDAALLQHLNLEVATVAGNTSNCKITTFNDITMIENNIKYETRTGMGFDAHKFCPPKQASNNHIMLCGVAVPHNMSLEGHSDADVALHALVDAILGAIAAGDIGRHFPPTDQKWQGAASSIFLAYAGQLINELSARIINLDITIICQSPKISPHSQKMCETIAKILAIEKTRVSVKATTTEGMGFTGRQEGIAAQAIATIEVKAQ